MGSRSHIPCGCGSYKRVTKDLCRPCYDSQRKAQRRKGLLSKPEIKAQSVRKRKRRDQTHAWQAGKPVAVPGCVPYTGTDGNRRRNAFLKRYLRLPKGTLVSTCGTRMCLNPCHMEDYGEYGAGYAEVSREASELTWSLSEIDLQTIPANNIFWFPSLPPVIEEELPDIFFHGPCLHHRQGTKPGRHVSAEEMEAMAA